MRRSIMARRKPYPNKSARKMSGEQGEGIKDRALTALRLTVHHSMDSSSRYDL